MTAFSQAVWEVGVSDSVGVLWGSWVESSSRAVGRIRARESVFSMERSKVLNVSRFAGERVL